ncbi:hypothetical protein LH128_04614 [Sphingomonas sp. LH128]|uniref:Uncharacterized protein n=1 Tax=Novosphingobium resinovorum TaxID=158500 RepID=A0A1D8A2A2_9SPHN|nr:MULTISPECIES: hypothetical protein [Sphingomonadaceae]AOR76261.1 hypothetical protein BES08_05435 [Novosphingobium resinovorum]EJU14250.1 hypothetical protein LH128_04614 [Sphingomonas sp. LH128]
MNKLVLTVATAALAIAGTSSVAYAAAPKAAAKSAAKPAAAAPAGGDSQAQHAMLYLKVLISGLQSDKIEEPVKGALVGCIYDNSLGKITESMDKVIAENSGKISRDNPSELLSVMAQICGYKPTAPAAGTAPAKPAPQGR